MLVQGHASFDPHPDPYVLAQIVRPASERFMGAAKTGRFWHWWLRAYYASRILVTVHVERVSSWPDLSGRPMLGDRGAPVAIRLSGAVSRV